MWFECGFVLFNYISKYMIYNSDLVCIICLICIIMGKTLQKAEFSYKKKSYFQYYCLVLY